MIYLTILSMIHAVTAAADKFDNSEKDLGDICYLKDNQRGSCEEIMKCEHAKELFRSKKTSEIVHCRFRGKIPLVCCPKLMEPLKLELDLCKNKFSRDKMQMKAKTEEFYYYVALGYKKEDGMMEIRCSGSLIAENIVLTTASCVSMDDSRPMMAGLSRTHLNPNDSLDDKPAQVIEVENVNIHPNYSNVTKQNDIAIIKLKKPAILSELVDTICLSRSDDNLPKEFNLIDFEIPNPNKSGNLTWLIKETIYQESIDNCTAMLNAISDQTNDSQICVLSSSENKSLKVAGNPMNYEENSVPFLYGITSYGIPHGPFNVVVYTKVNKYLDWIDEVMTNMD